MRISNYFRLTVIMIVALAVMTGAAFAADPGQIIPAQKEKLQIQQKPVLQLKGSSFSCTFKPWSSGLPAGGPLGGTGLFNYGMSMTVKNVGTTDAYGIYGSLVLKVNGAVKNKTCTPTGVMLNQFLLAPGKSASHNLNCGTESNVSASQVTSGSAFVQSNDGKKFNCTLDTSVPVIK